ncbi:MAG: DUF819 family protein [Planctomycetota bacterium]|nr:DUF819 family protein [Planctomycetota bacterium]
MIPGVTCLAQAASAEAATPESPKAEMVVTEPVAVLAVLLLVLAVLFGMARHRSLGRIFKVVPLLVFAYFVPTLLSNTGVIPLKSPLYDFVKTWLLPASLLLLTISVDIPGILRLGPKVLFLFLTATASIVVGGPVAYLALGLVFPGHLDEEAWRGLAALSGSWIGGGANFIAIGKSVEASDQIIALMVVVDVAVANVWMAVLLYFAGRERAMDERLGADRRALEDLRLRLESYQAEVHRPTTLPDLLLMLALAIGVTALATWLSHPEDGVLRPIGDIVRPFTWVVIIVTTVGVVLSFTPLRRLEGAGASAVGSVFLYLLVATIGAHGDFSRLGEAPVLLGVGALWMLIHAASMLIARRFLRAPIFFAAVGSQANVGGAASAPVVAGAFHPALAPVGALLAVAGYVLGTYAGLVCAFLLKMAHGLLE